MQAHLDLPLADAAEAGWTLQWQAVRRRLNRAADALATVGVHWAARLLLDEGRQEQRYTWHWGAEDPGQPRL